MVYLDQDAGGYYNGKIKFLEMKIKADINDDKSKAPVNEVEFELAYDESGRLLSAENEKNPAFSLTGIKYDQNGNIITAEDGGIIRKLVMEKNTDKIISCGASTFSHDKKGAVTGITTAGKTAGITYYPYSGLPRQFSGEGYRTEILYDENNCRLRKTVFKAGEAASDKIYRYENAGLAEEISDGRSVKFLRGLTGINAVSCNGIDYSVITDRLGYVRVVAECEKIIQAYHYKPFGEAIKVIEESPLVNFLFGGYEWDRETNLYISKSRLYSPEIFRFLSTDPQSEFASPYLFCGNDPFAIMDADGDASWIGALIGTIVGIVLTVTLSVLTMGTTAPLAVAVFGPGGTSITTSSAAAAATAAGVETAATSAAKIAAIVAYNTLMTTGVSLVSGLAADGVSSLIDGGPVTTAGVYSNLFNSVITGMVFGGAGTLISGVGRFVVEEGDKALVRAGKYLAQGAILSLVNAGVSAAVSPMNDFINQEDPSGINAAAGAGFGVLSALLTTFSVPIANKFSKASQIAREAISTAIWSGLDPGTYYDIAVEAVNADENGGVYDSYNVGEQIYMNTHNSADKMPVKNEQMIKAYACFGNDHGVRNMYAPRFFATRGFGPKLL